MAYTPIPVRIPYDVIPASDVNQLQENCDYLKSITDKVTQTPASGSIPLADSNGKLDSSWIDKLGDATQSWQNVTSSRTVNVTYTNTTGKGIAVFIDMSASGIGSYLNFSCNGVVIVTATGAYQSSERIKTLIIIQSGASYRVTGSGTVSINAWLELR